MLEILNEYIFNLFIFILIYLFCCDKIIHFEFIHQGRIHLLICLFIKIENCEDLENNILELPVV